MVQAVQQARGNLLTQLSVGGGGAAGSHAAPISVLQVDV